MYVLTRLDRIWNRAALESGGSAPCQGDKALAALLHAHGLVMNGGVVHALGALSQSEIADAIAGFRYFGLPSAADVLAQEPDDSEETEERLNLQYWQAVPHDDAIDRAFRRKILASPDAFAPLVDVTQA